MSALEAALRLAAAVDDLNEIATSELAPYAEDLDHAAEAIEAVVLAVRAGGRRPTAVLAAVSFAEVGT